MASIVLSQHLSFVLDVLSWKHEKCFFRAHFLFQPLKRQPHKMARDIQTIRRLLPTNCLSVFDHFVRLALEGFM